MDVANIVGKFQWTPMEEMLEEIVKLVQVEEKELEKLVKVRESKGSIQR